MYIYLYKINKIYAEHTLFYLENFSQNNFKSTMWQNYYYNIIIDGSQVV